MIFSLKSKILLGLTSLLVLCTAFNLGYSYKLFVDDKTSYIFENGLKKAESISDQINFKINEVVDQTETNTILLNTNSINYDKYINAQKSVVLTGLVDIINGRPVLANTHYNLQNINHLKNSFGINSQELLKNFIDHFPSLIIPSESQYRLYSPHPEVNLFINVSKLKNSNRAYFTIVNFSPIFEIFKKDKNFENKIVFLKEKEDVAKYAEFISKINSLNNKKGTFEIVHNGEATLTSYSHVNNNILILSIIKKDSAFGITRFLVLKTSLFALFLIGIATIIGIYFSTSLTSPITILTRSAKQIAQGDFSSENSIKTNDEINILANAFNFMSSEIQALLKSKEELILQLEDYNRNLENKVAQRTAELKEANDFMGLMVNSLDQGLLVFDQELKCHPTHTNACESIFNSSPFGNSLPEILDITDEHEIQSLKQWTQILFSEMIPFESASALGPQQKITGNDFTDPNYKYVDINYYPMRDSEEKIVNVVMIATDKTREIQATERAKEKDLYVSMVLKILTNKPQFESFINEVEEIFDQFETAYSIENATINFELCMMLFHTLNGGFGIYSLTKLQQLAREYESEISAMKDTHSDPVEYIPFLRMHVSNLRSEFLVQKQELDSILGTKFAFNEAVTEIPRIKILELKKMIENASVQSLFDYYMDHFVKVPVINYFKIYDDLCKTTSIKINKEFQGLTFINPDLKIEAEPLLEFFNVLVHLFRNCLDHGLEDPHAREASGKTPYGNISVSFDEFHSPDEKFLSLIIQDDGAGIHPEKIRERYLQLNPDADISNLSDKEIIYKIFDPFFSTRDEVSALSGRGVGMSAIKEVVDRLKGQIEIESHINKGTTFSFMIPL